MGKPLILVLLVLLVAVVGVLGYLGYQRHLVPAGHRACARLADRCGLSPDHVSACRKVLGEVREASGGEAAGRLARCLSDASSCSMAAGCAAGSGLGMLSRSMLELLDGLRRAR
jgi:hypothetical protein